MARCNKGLKKSDPNRNRKIANCRASKKVSYKATQKELRVQRAIGRPRKTRSNKGTHKAGTMAGIMAMGRNSPLYGGFRF